MARCLAGHETASVDFCDICGARVSGTPGYGLERGAGKHRGPDRGTPSDGRICPGCGAPAPGQFCDACGLRIRVRNSFGTSDSAAEEFPSGRTSAGPPESLFPPITRPGASPSPWAPAEPPSSWNTQTQQAAAQQAPARQTPAQQAPRQQAPVESPSSWSKAQQQVQADPSAPWNLPADPSAPWNAPAESSAPWNAPADSSAPWNAPAEPPARRNAPAEPPAPWNAPAEQAAPWGAPTQPVPPAAFRPPVLPGSSGDTGASNLLESLFSPESPAAPAAQQAPSTPPVQAVPFVHASPSAQAAPPAAPPRAESAAPPRAESAAPVLTEPPAPARPERAAPVAAKPPAPVIPVSPGPAAPPTRPIPALAVAWTVLIASDRSYYDMMRSVRDQYGPDVSFPVRPAERRIRLTGPQMRIGRRSATRELKPEIDLAEQPVDPGVSRLHAVLIASSDGNWSILDPGSANGTLLNGREIPEGEEILLHEGDRINLGAWTVISMHRS